MNTLFISKRSTPWLFENNCQVPNRITLMLNLEEAQKGDHTTKFALPPLHRVRITTLNLSSSNRVVRACSDVSFLPLINHMMLLPHKSKIKQIVVASLRAFTVSHVHSCVCYLILRYLYSIKSRIVIKYQCSFKVLTSRIAIKRSETEATLFGQTLCQILKGSTSFRSSTTLMRASCCSNCPRQHKLFAYFYEKHVKTGDERTI